MSFEISWEAVSALGTVAGVAVAILALVAAAFMLKEAKRARKVTLSITLSERFSCDDMHNALAYLGRRRDQYKRDSKAMCDAYVAEAEEARTDGKVSEWDRNRRKVSKFFIAAHALCKEGLLEQEVFAGQIGRASIDLYVQVVVPLNHAQAVRVQGREDYFDDWTRDFFIDFLMRHFGRMP